MSRKIRVPMHESPFWRAYLPRRYAILFYTLLAMLFVIPSARTIGLPLVITKFVLGACLLVAVVPNGTKKTRRALVAGVLLLIVLRFGSDRLHLPIAPGWTVALYGMIGLLAAAGALRFTVTARQVDAETVYAALSTYLLAGLFFGQIYWALEQAWPGSLIGPDPVSDSTTLYYSFVTLATLGYGDYLPRTDFARGVATFEVIGGQLFLAVLVARLIGLFKRPPDET